MARLIKTFGDRFIAALALLLLSPIILLVAVLIRLQMGSPIIFTQARPGKDGKIFQFLYNLW